MKKNSLGCERFPDLIENDLVYVDKTGYISAFAEGGSYYLSRPRYFGKSLFLDTLKAAFEGRKPLFKGLALEKNWDWEKQFPVLKISFSNFYIRTARELELAIAETLGEIETFHQLKSPEKGTLASRFYLLIKGLFEKSGKKIVVLVDDCAKPLHDTYDNPATVIECQKVLKGFYTVLKRSTPYVHLAFFCGIGNFYKNSLFIGLSEMTDVSLDADFSSLCGFTREEAEFLLSNTDSTIEAGQLEQRYYGYSWGAAEKCYNPFDVLSAIKEGKCRDFWAEAVHSKQIVSRYRESGCYLPTLQCLSASENSLLQSDMCAIDFVSYLFQMGYLTIDRFEEDSPFRHYTLSYPNASVKASLVMRVLRELVQSTPALIDNITALCRALNGADMGAFLNIINAFFQSIPGNHLQRQLASANGGFHTAVFYGYFVTTGFELVLEEVNGYDHICISVRASDVVYYFDFSVGKRGSNSHGIIDQVKEQGHAVKRYGNHIPVYTVVCVCSADQNRIVRLDWEHLNTPEQALAQD